MEAFNKKKHWENIYNTKLLNEVSWYQPTPQTSLALIEKCALPKNSKIIDIGGGDSFLVDHLLKMGFSNITVLDISPSAISRAKNRLGQLADKVKWIVADITQTILPDTYDIWHDRAAFHFLTTNEDIAGYVQTANTYINRSGNLIIGTFSENGPTKCSGINIKQYSKSSLAATFSHSFTVLESVNTDHPTPFDTIQNFIFCRFEKINL